VVRVSALGAEDIDVVRERIDLCLSSANKSLHAVSGVGVLCVSARAWDRIESAPRRTYYLDLNRYRYYADHLAQTPFTPAVSAYFALDAACAEFLEDGHLQRFAMYRRRNELLRAGLAAIGMAAYTGTGNESHSLVTCRVPEGIAVQDIYDRLRERGFIVYACKGALADQYMQIANMGDLRETQIHRFLAAIGDVLADLGHVLPKEGLALA
jgi:aspartate aminotransferase-like enzyme